MRVKRYDTGRGQDYECSSGRYVHHSDYAALLASHNALREAVAWYLEYDQFFDWMWDQIGDNDDELPSEEEIFAGHWAARAEVDRLIATADCKGEG